MQPKLTMASAKKMLLNFCVSSAREYQRFRNSSHELKALLPADPSVYYRKEWKSWNEFLGKSEKSDEEYRIEMLQQQAIALNLATKEEWRLAVLQKKIDGPLNISNLQGFTNWKSFLKQSNYLPFSELLAFTRGLGLKTQTDWRNWNKLYQRPCNVPYDLSGHYKEDYGKLVEELELRKISFWKYIFQG